MPLTKGKCALVHSVKTTETIKNQAFSDMTVRHGISMSLDFSFQNKEKVIILESLREMEHCICMPQLRQVFVLFDLCFKFELLSRLRTYVRNSVLFC